MPNPRKTLSVLAIVEEANSTLSESFGIFGPGHRMGVCLFVESLLRRTNQYAGFGYLEEDKVPPGEKPGIIRGFNPEGERDNKYNVYPDQTRRAYYIKKG